MPFTAHHRILFNAARLAAAVLMLTAALSTVSDASAADFVTGIEDLPLMEGLSEDTEALLVFDKPSGRIVEAYATGAVSRAAVAKFYAETLPQLGWRAAAELTFTREGETLRITVSKAAGLSTVRFALSPK